MADKKSFVLYCDYRKHFSLLSPEDQGHLLMAIFDYVETGVEPEELDAMPLMAFSFIRAQLDRDFASYQETCKRRAEAGRKSGEVRRAKAEAAEQNGTKGTSVHSVQQNEQKGTKRTDTDNDNDTDNDTVTDNVTDISVKGNSQKSPKKKTTSRFVPPTVEEVRAYCQERNNTVNAEKFVAYYTSNGWMVGKTKMKEWKSAVLTWEHNEKEKPQYRPKPVQNKAYHNPALDYYNQLMAEEADKEATH